MSTDNTDFRNFFPYPARQSGERNSHHATLNQPVFTPATPHDPSQSRTRPRHHFRRGAISEISGRSIFPATNPAQPLAQQGIRIRAITHNQLEVTILPAAYNQQYNQLQTISSASRTQRHQGSALADQTHRVLVNMSYNMTYDMIYTGSALQAQIEIIAAALQDPTLHLPNRAAMADNDATDQPRDTRRYGREGWWTVQDRPATNQRPSTIPGSSFVVPDSTLNLFQSVDLFAPPQPEARMTVPDLGAALLQAHVRHYASELDTMFDRLVTDRRRGLPIPSGQIFVVSLERSRLQQLLQILREEDFMHTMTRDAPRTERSRRQDQRQNDGMPEVAADDDSSTADSDEPEGWANLPFVLNGDFPHEVCFHIGSRRVTFPIEAVEEWIVNERRRGIRAARTRQPPQRPYAHLRGPPPGGDYQRRWIQHTLSLPNASGDRTWPREDTYGAHDRYNDDAYDVLPDPVTIEDVDDDDDVTEHEPQRYSWERPDGYIGDEDEDEEEGEEEGEEEDEEEEEDYEGNGEEVGEGDSEDEGEEEGVEGGEDDSEDLDEQ